MTINFLTKATNGLMQLVQAIQSSAGAGDAEKIIATDANGLIDASFLPVATAAGTTSISNLPASENLTAGQFVHFDASGVIVADSSSAATEANGFVLSAYTNGDNNVIVYTNGGNSALSGLTVGSRYYLGTGGGVSLTPPAFAAGSICQYLGTASTPAALSVEIDRAVEYNNQ